MLKFQVEIWICLYCVKDLKKLVTLLKIREEFPHWDITILNCGLKQYETKIIQKISNKLGQGFILVRSFAYYQDGVWSTGI